jgi:hypothetical protein
MDKYPSVTSKLLQTWQEASNTPPVNKKSILSHLTIKLLIPKGQLRPENLGNCGGVSFAPADHFRFHQTKNQK